MMRVCVLRAGRDFQPKHVQWLAKQIPGIVCLSDVPVEGVKTIPLKHEWPGWWAKMELFRPDIEDDFLYFDLDTVITGPLEDFDVGVTTMLSDFYRPDRPASGLMYIKHEDKSKVWNDWLKSPEQHMKRCSDGDAWGDQGYLMGVLDAKRWQDLLPGKVCSYKAHGFQKSASVVCFHGKPRPWNVRLDWVPTL